MHRSKALFGTAAVLLVLLAGCSGTSGDTSNRNLIVTRYSDARAEALPEEFYIGMPRTDVFELISEDPSMVFYGDVYYEVSEREADAYYFYGDLGLSFQILGDEVNEITLVNEDWIASNGLMVGITKDMALEILGDGYLFNEGVGKDFYEYQEYDISLEVSHSNGLVEEINIRANNRI